MTRPVVLGNGNIMVGLDAYGRVRDFYYPYVGWENHVGRRDAHKIGVWVEGRFSWVSEASWEVSTSYEPETLVSRIELVNKDLQVSIIFRDVVYNEKNIFLRSFEVYNHADTERDIRLFFNQQFEISQSYYADTAYYNSSIQALVHYKSRRVFCIGGQTDEGDIFDQYSAGLFNIEGQEGTWRDAEDGVLAKNPIEHGSVDSTLGFSLTVPAGESVSGRYWICVGKTYSEVERLQDMIIHKTPEHLLKTTADFWRAWVNKTGFSFFELGDEVIEMFKRSLLIIRTHADNRGGILASGDTSQFQHGRDTYAYVWPRDGMFISLAMDKAGYFDTSKRFYRFCSEVITDGGYMLHKYQPNKSLGSSWHPWTKDNKPQLAIQEDETALLLFGLWEHYRYSKDLEFVEGLYNSFIRSAAEFIRNYKDQTTGLPAPSYGLWEETYGISTFTSASVYGALVAAGRFAELLGKDAERDLYFSEAESIREAIMTHLFSKTGQYFYKGLRVKEGQVEIDRTVDASGFYGPFLFRVLDPTDPRMANAHLHTMQTIGTNKIGGVARYEGDTYHLPSEAKGISPGNPWIVTTMWMSRYRIATATGKKDLKQVKEDLSWVSRHALSSGVLSEQLHPFTGAPLSVAPLTWSHAEYVLTVVEYLHKLEELGVCKACYPLSDNGGVVI